MKKRIQSLVSVLTLLVTAAWAQAESAVYEIDPVHSGVLFKVRHHFTTVPGSFGDFSGSIRFDAGNPESSEVEASISTASIFTHNAQRDGHLQSDDFFSADRFPEMTFKSSSWKQVGDNRYEVEGELSMAGETNPVTLDVTYLGEGSGNNDTTIAGWNATTTLDRSDWGITFATGMIGNEVEIEIHIQAIKAA